MGHGMGEKKQRDKRKNGTVTLLQRPRGLVNQSNYCYLNSIVQSLLFIPAFQKLLQRSNLPKDTMLLAAFQELLKEYQKTEELALDATTIHSALGG